MSDRRRTTRYVLDTPLPGSAMPMEDVTVEHCSGERVVVISPSAHRIDDALLIHLRTAAGLRSHQTRVVSSSAVAVSGAVRFRLELQIEGDGAPACGDYIA